MEDKPTVFRETIALEQGPEAVHDWIIDELGDEELAQYVKDHPEASALTVSGERLLPTSVFDLLGHLDETQNPNTLELLSEMQKGNYFPQLSSQHIVGNLSSEQKETVMFYQQYIVAQSILTLAENEREKTEEDYLMIDRAGRELTLLRGRFGLPPLVFSPDAVHFIDSDHILDNGKVLGGGLSPYEQMVHSGTWKSPAIRMEVLFHELAHLNSYAAFQEELDKDDGGIDVGVYRLGLEVHKRELRNGKREGYLRWMNEAVTEELTRKFILSLKLDDPEFGYVAALRKSHIEHYFKTHPEFAEQYGNTPEEVADIEPVRDAEGKSPVVRFAYPDERMMLYSLFDKLYERNPEQFAGKTQEEVHEELFDMLTRAMFTGNILPFGRLFNDTFGRGKFREFAHLQTTEEQVEFMESL